MLFLSGKTDTENGKKRNAPGLRVRPVRAFADGAGQAADAARQTMRIRIVLYSAFFSFWSF